MNSADKALVIIKRAGRQEIERKKLDRRMYGVYRMMEKRAERLGRAREIDFDVAYLREMAQAFRRTLCKYCAVRLNAKNIGVDHATPTARGGSFSRTNLSFPCKSCNTKKGNLTHVEFRSVLDVLDKFPAVARGDVLTRLGLGGQFRSWNTQTEATDQK